jgi:hypothetical protein
MEVKAAGVVGLTRIVPNSGTEEFLTGTAI